MLNFSDLVPYADVFLGGLLTTMELTALTTVLGVLLGTFCASVRQYGSVASQRLVSCYVELIRNTPFIVQLFFIFFGLPSLGLLLTPWQASVLALTINLGAYSTEIIRAGLNNVPAGQWEAAKVLGMNFRQTLTRVVFIPAFEKIYPALTSQCIIVMLGSAVLSQISVEDLTYAANLIQSRNFRAFESYVVTALMYLGLAMTMRYLFTLLGRRLFAYREES